MLKLLIISTLPKRNMIYNLIFKYHQEFNLKFRIQVFKPSDTNSQWQICVYVWVVVVEFQVEGLGCVRVCVCVLCLKFVKKDRIFLKHLAFADRPLKFPLIIYKVHYMHKFFI